VDLIPRVDLGFIMDLVPRVDLGFIMDLVPRVDLVTNPKPMTGI
jgi:hypothetical protein